MLTFFFLFFFFFFFFNDTATTEIYTLSLHDALPISRWRSTASSRCSRLLRVAWPRQVAMYLAREHTGATLPPLPRAHGRRNIERRIAVARGSRPSECARRPTACVRARSLPPRARGRGASRGSRRRQDRRRRASSRTRRAS